MKIKKLYCAVLILCLSGGCASNSYLRTASFSPEGGVRSIYVMPVAIETTRDPAIIENEKNRRRLGDAYVNVKETIQKEFLKKGYQFSAHPKVFQFLDKQDKQEHMLSLAVNEFLNPTPSENSPRVNNENPRKSRNPIDGFIESMISPLTALGKETKSVGEFPVERYIQLVQATENCKSIFPQGTDAVLFVRIKNHVASRGFLGAVKDESVTDLTFQVVSLKDQALVFSFNQVYPRTDLLLSSRINKSIADILTNLPDRLIQASRGKLPDQLILSKKEDS